MASRFDVTNTDIAIQPSRLLDQESTPLYSLVIYHQGGARLETLFPGQSKVIGRGVDVNLHIPDTTLSRRHAEFELRGTDVWLRDLGSTNGTCVNGRKVTEQKLRPGDAVTLGGLLINVIVPDAGRSLGRLTPPLLGCFEQRVVHAMLCASDDDNEAGIDYDARLQRCERKVVDKALTGTRGDEPKAAEVLQISLDELQRIRTASPPH